MLQFYVNKYLFKNTLCKYKLRIQISVFKYMKINDNRRVMYIKFKIPVVHYDVNNI